MVNTFLPFPSFEASARCLDNKRLGKQRVEAYQARAFSHQSVSVGLLLACADVHARRGARLER
jgi:hypothetical protein